MTSIKDRAARRYPNSENYQLAFCEGWDACVRRYFGDGPVAPKPAEDGEPTTAQIMDKLQDIYIGLNNQRMVIGDSIGTDIRDLRRVIVDVGQKVHDGWGNHLHDMIVDVGQKVEAVQSQLVDIELIAARTESYVETQDHPAEDPRAAAYAAAKETLRKQVEDEQHMAKVLESREPHKPGDCNFCDRSGRPIRDLGPYGKSPAADPLNFAAEIRADVMRDRLAREGSVAEERDHLRDTVRPMMKAFVPGYMADTPAPDGKARTILGVDAAAPGGDKTVVSIQSREGLELITPPDWAGEIVSTCLFQGAMIVACQHGVFRVVDGELKPIRFVTA